MGTTRKDPLHIPHCPARGSVSQLCGSHHERNAASADVRAHLRAQRQSGPGPLRTGALRLCAFEHYHPILSGIFGEEFGTPIINQPDSAILAIGGLKKEPVVVIDAQGDESIAIRSVQYFCLGFDHRIIDGADAGRFMSEFKKTLENWSQDIG